MSTCAVASCKNNYIKTKNTEVRYFGFPKNVNLLNQWKDLCGRKDNVNFNNARICSVHFEQSNFEIPLRHRLLNYNPKNFRNLKSDALPTLGLPRSSQKLKCMSDKSEMESQPATSNIREPPLQQNDQKRVTPKDLTIYCRLCLNPVDKNQMICLGNFHDINYPKNKILLTENYLKMIKIVLPNLDHTLVNNPVMCNDCSTHLEVAFDFVEQCMDTQTHIQQFKNENCPWKKMVNCEEVVRNKTQLPTSSAEVPLNPKKRKLEELLSAKCVEQPCQPQTIPPDEFETIFIKMEESEEMEQENHEIIQEEICDIKEEMDEEVPQIQTDDAIQRNVAIRTQSEHSLPANYVIKSGPFSTETKTNNEKQCSAIDVSCNVKSTFNNSSCVVSNVGLPSQLYSTVPCPNSSNLNVVVPMGYILVNPMTFSSLKSKLQNS